MTINKQGRKITLKDYIFKKKVEEKKQIKRRCEGQRCKRKYMHIRGSVPTSSIYKKI